MKFKLGLTGSIGMGKSTTAALFADEGCVVWDADAAVHRLYAAGGAALPEFQRKFPSVVVDGAVDRAALRGLIQKAPAALEAIEKIVHPLVRQDRDSFADGHHDKVGVFDIPLLFETGAEADMDAVVCVTVSAQEQRKRVRERGTMTAAQLDQILSRQMPNDEKCARSNYVIVTDTLENAKAQVQDVMQAIKGLMEDA